MPNSGSFFSRAKSLLFPGILSSILLFILLLFSAALGNEICFFQEKQGLIAKSCLLLTAVLCGLIHAGRAGERKLVAALLGESVMAVLLLVLCILCRVGPVTASFGIDILCLAFGGFAGTLLSSRNVRKRKRKK